MILCVGGNLFKDRVMSVVIERVPSLPHNNLARFILLSLSENISDSTNESMA